MIFLPNFFERYIASLRNTVQISALKNGKRQKDFDNMQKIYTTEALYGNEENVPLDLGEYLSRLLTTLYILRSEVGRYFEFSIHLRGRYMVKIKIFTAFMLTLCKECEKIEIYEHRGKIVMRVWGMDFKKVKKYIKIMNLNIFYERKNGISGICFPFSSTLKKQNNTYFENLDITNPFSPINIYFNSSF